MISLKKHIDDWNPAEAPSVLSAYSSLLLTIGAGSIRAVPDLGDDLERKLTTLNGVLEADPTQESLSQTHENARGEISQWADKAHQRAADSERELRDVVLMMAKAIATVGERDTRYAREVTELTERLRSVATLTDLTAIRHFVIESATALTDCVQRIAADSQASLHRLSAEVEEYRTRLEKSETLSSLDPLTGLSNRRRLEDLLALKMKARDTFSLILIDLNGFKTVNDRFGHLTGDDLLKQFAGELRSRFRTADLVARWGGDEFVVILACNHADAVARLQHLRRNVLGDYKVDNGTRTVTITLGASIGVVEWDRKESGRNLLARADYCMYSGKESKAAVD
ncbi:MAG: GGDEF domain-containing protein [Bryobacteraceae bacterium]|jgi:diguanylate cyclase (GGDEF)-like protein